MNRGFLDDAAEKSQLRSRLLAAAPRSPSLREAVSRALWEGRPGIILEYKRCRPGGFVAYRTPWEYIEAVGQSADAWSVLVEPYWFCGSPELVAFFAATGKPVLAKDFTVSVEQLEVYQSVGASASLLILDMLGWDRLEALYEESRRRGLDVLIETTSADDAIEAMNSYPEALVGINARNLRSLDLSFERLREEIEKAAARKPSGGILVAESGIDSLDKARAAVEAGADALLIGTWAMRSPGEAAALRRHLEGLLLR